MNDMTDDDWMMLNAYHDGELTEAETRAMDARLKAEPSLAAALEEIGHLSTSLSALRPQIAQTRPEPLRANDNRRLMGWGLGGAVAAALVASIVFGMASLSPASPYDIHRKLAAHPFGAEKSDLSLAASHLSVGIPDLGGANLVPVAFRTVGGGSITHYAGRNGCRLTYFRNVEAVDLRGAKDADRVATWTTPDDLHHAIIATGMDEGKYAAIMAYLEMISRSRSDGTVVASLYETTRSAEPCAV